jgi:hypothetical protein
MTLEPIVAINFELLTENYGVPGFGLVIIPCHLLEIPGGVLVGEIHPIDVALPEREIVGRHDGCMKYGDREVCGYRNETVEWLKSREEGECAEFITGS